MEIEPCRGIPELTDAEHLRDLCGSGNNRVEFIWIEEIPEIDKVGVGELACGCDGGVGGGVIIAIAVYEHIDCIAELSARDICADLAQGDGKQIEALEADSLVRSDKRASALFQVDKVRLALDAGFGDKRALGDDFEFLFIVARLAGYRAVVE